MGMRRQQGESRRVGHAPPSRRRSTRQIHLDVAGRSGHHADVGRHVTVPQRSAVFPLTAFLVLISW